MNKKSLIVAILIFVVVISITTMSLYQTFATDDTIGHSVTYDINLGEDNIITVPAKSSKTIYYKISNTNEGAVRYRVGYSSDDGITVEVYEDSEAPETGIIEKNENIFIKLKLVNNTDKDGEVTLYTVLGYENDENIIAPSGTNLVTDKIAKTNYMITSHGNSGKNFLNTDLLKTQIGTITTVNNNIVPSGIPEENIFDVSKKKEWKYISVVYL